MSLWSLWASLGLSGDVSWRWRCQAEGAAGQIAEREIENVAEGASMGLDGKMPWSTRSDAVSNRMIDKQSV